MGRVRRGEDDGALGPSLLGQAEVHVVGREQAQAAVVVLSVIPGEETLAVGPGVLERAEAVREGRLVLGGFEVGLRERVVIDTWGREWVLVTPRSASSKTTDFEVIAAPRSA